MTVKWVYGEDVVVLIKCDAKYIYIKDYVDFWYLNLRELYDGDDLRIAVRERHGVACIDKQNVSIVIEQAQELGVATLRNLVKSLDYESRNLDDIMYFPSLFVDFDAKMFYNHYYESRMLSECVPEGWTAKDGSFEPLVPDDLKYWLDGDRDFLKDFESGA